MLRIPRLPLAGAAFQRAPGQCNKRVLSGSASRRSRKLGTAFRSPVTTLSPPLRGQCSWPAPSIPRQRLSRIRSIRGSSARFGFEAETGRIHHPRPVVRADLRRSHDAITVSTPLGFFDPPDQSVQPASSQEARLAGRPIVFRSPPRSLSICASDQCSKLRFVLLGYRSVNPGTESIMHPAATFSVKRKSRGFPQLFEAIFSVSCGRFPVDSVCINQRLLIVFNSIRRIF